MVIIDVSVIVIISGIVNRSDSRFVLCLVSAIELYTAKVNILPGR